MATHGQATLRRVLLMVHELHHLGFQRLRIAPSISSSGAYWRCIVTPRFNTLKNNGARVGVWNNAMAFYSSAQEDEPFDWSDAKEDSPKQLAGKFIVRYPAIVMQSHGEDLPYAEWYSRMIAATEPGGLISALEDIPMISMMLGSPTDLVQLARKIECGIRALGVEVDIPLPPPGEADYKDCPNCYSEDDEE